ncbi:MAG: glycosyltransferase family 39 protein, partial [Verrucomicrobia bacterium]
MSAPDPASSPSRDALVPPFFTRWPAAIVLVLLCATVYLTALGSRPLWDGDEGLHAATSRDMVLTGNWITPYANGEPFFDKPAFFNWAVAASFELFGFTEFAARLPAALFGTACVLALWFFGSRMFDPLTGFFGAAALATSVQFVILSRTIVHDIALALFITLTLGSFFLAYRSPDDRRTPWMLAVYLFSGLGVLAKGPIGVLLPGMVVFLFLLFRRRLDFILRARLATGTLLFLAVAAPWYILIARQNPDYLQRFFLGTNFGYFFGNDTGAGHPQPWYHYIPALLGGMFPWSLALPGALWLGFRRSARPMSDAMLF